MDPIGKTAVLLECYPSAAGGEAVAFGMIKRERLIASLLQREGYAVHCFKPTRGRLRANFTSWGCTWRFFPIDAKSDEVPDNAVRSRELEVAVQQLCPDLLILRGAGTEIGRELARNCNNARTLVIISGRYRTSTLAAADVVLTEVSQQEAFLRKRMCRDRIVRLPKYVSPQFSSTRSSQKHFDVVVVSKFESHKNHAALMPLLDHPLRIAFLGSGSLLEAFAKTARQGRADCNFFGDVERDQLADILARSKVLAHPSLSEGFPRAVTEAMALGVPPVGFKRTLSWPLVHLENAVLVADPQRYCDAVMKVVMDEALQARLGEAARKTAETNFSCVCVEGSLRSALDRLNADVEACVPPYRTRFRSRLRIAIWNAGTTMAKPLRALQRIASA